MLKRMNCTLVMSAPAAVNALVAEFWSLTLRTMT